MQFIFSFSFCLNNIRLSLIFGTSTISSRSELRTYVFKGFGSDWSDGKKGDLHIDAQGPEPFIEFSTIMYLSDPKDYEGGVIYFPNQDFSYKPIQYSAVLFPSSGTEYIHGITAVTSGRRFTALYMHTSLPQYSDPDYHPNPGPWKAGDYNLAKL